VRVHPNRDKVSFYGTLNLQTGQEVVSKEATMNSEATARHLEKVLATYPGTSLLLLWDRASWHGGPLVRAVLEANPRLEVMCFLKAAPDLNLQEMVWKATRAAMSHNHDERQLVSLADQFEQHLVSTKFSYSLLQEHGHGHVRAIIK
jgi:hypothetical protein